MDERKGTTYGHGHGRDLERSSDSFQAASGIIPSKASSDAERRLRTKIDLHLVPIVAILYLFCFIDRANLGNAKIAGLDRDIGMVGYDYNITLSVFYVGYILFEIPAVLLCKYMGPGWFIPLTSIMFGICSISTAFVKTVPQACAVRFLLGIFEAGMMPSIAYYLSRWYRRAELTFRISLYIVMAPLAGAFGGLLASAILSLPRISSLTSWRVIFAIEGLLTVFFAFLALILLTDRPETARWLSQEEKNLAVSRVKAERNTHGALLDKLGKRKFLQGATNPVTLSIGFSFMLDAIVVQTFAFFLPTIVKTIFPEKTTIQQQLFTAPPYLVGACIMLAMAFTSWRIDRRQIFFILSTPLVMAGYSMYLASADQKIRYAAAFLSSCAFTLGTLTNAQVSANVVSDTARSAAIGINSMFAHIGGLIGSWSFLPYDAPLYPIGNGLNLASSGAIFAISAVTLVWMRWDNRRRDRVQAEGGGVLDDGDLEELDWRHPSFRWKP
ncbi:hypothetical protein OQA88_5974 [Cercophora sp. LCS_1]